MLGFPWTHGHPHLTNERHMKDKADHAKLRKLAGLSHRYGLPQTSMRRITALPAFPSKIKIGGHSLWEIERADEFMLSYRQPPRKTEK